MMLAVGIAGYGFEPARSWGAPEQPAISAAERALIEGKICEHLNLPAGTALGTAEFAQVTELNLSREPVSDAGAAWLSDPATGLSFVTTLNLQQTMLTDAGVQALARNDTGLKRLTALYLGLTKVTDPGVEALAHGDSGLRGLT